MSDGQITEQDFSSPKCLKELTIVDEASKINEQYDAVVKKIFDWADARQKLVPNKNRVDMAKMRLFASLLGNPQKQFKIIHVAGTNGKGSTSIKVATCLEKLLGQRVGLFTSPHIVSFRERFIVNGKLPSKADVVEAAHVVFEVLEQGTSLDISLCNWFECITMIGLLIF